MNKYVDKDGLQYFAEELTAKNKEIFAVKAEVGTPLVAATAAAMTDTSKIYVYTGSETGYTAGDWYYYDGSDWQSGGVYNSTAIQTDTSLSVSGMAADAKTVGDDLDALDGRLDTIEDDYVTESEMTAAISANVDATLSVSGKAADAAKTGGLIASEFSTSSAYSVGDYVMYQGDLYRFVAAHAAGAWDAAHVVEVSVCSDIKYGKEDYLNFAGNVLNSFVLENDFIYGRYLTNGFNDSAAYYCRNNKAYPPGDYEIGPYAARGYMAVEYVSDTQGVALYHYYAVSKMTIHANRPWYITFNSIFTDSDLAAINSDFVVRRILSSGDTLESKVKDLQNSEVFNLYESVYSKNRFNGAVFVGGGYIAPTDGSAQANAGHSYTDWIDISNHGSDKVVISNTHNAHVGYANLRYAFYTDEKVFISGGIAPTLLNNNSLNRDYAILDTPSNAAYMRFSMPNAVFTAVTDWQIEYSSVTAYSAYSGDWSGVSVESVVDNPTIDKLVSATYNRKPPQASAATLSDDETLIVENNSVMKNQYISFFGNISGSFDAVIVGHGQESYGYMIKVDGTNMTYGSNGSWGTAVAHGLTITDFIGVIIEVDVELNVKVTIVTKGGYFTRSQQIDSSWRGNVFATSDGTSFTDAVLTWNTDDYKCPLWAFGDSYFTIYSPTRWTYYIANKWGYNNILLNAYPGEASARALEDFKNALKHGMPKYVLWCMGMNDPDSSSAPNASWLQSIETVKGFCETYDIELIVTTIPIVTNASYNNTYKNAWVRNSGLRYVDFATALEDIDGWLSDDEVHPSEIGGRYMALKLLADVPEIAQGK